MWFEKIVKLIEHDPRADAHTASFEIQIADLPVVARELNDQAFANRVADQTCARAARRHRKPRISRCADYQARLLRAFRKCHTDRLDLINRRISGVKLTRQIIKTRVATGLPDFPFLRGSHLDCLNITRAMRIKKSALASVRPAHSIRAPPDARLRWDKTNSRYAFNA